MDLSDYVKDVFNASSVQDKKNALIEMVKASHGTKAVKNKALVNIQRINDPVRLDTMAFNYSAKGEGLGVI